MEEVEEVEGVTEDLPLIPVMNEEATSALMFSKVAMHAMIAV